ncbi:alpha/beta fold hydrolase [Nonomuraea jiangxiensis]|uniref:Pimeloyl-ACP methyl ester carboxylesterase n=1 Tax=Nonomuraea jiangxiensis TaxID=633440 RepID=A0A1G9CDW2_9ACTN|nr:alpha/beta hydrolase [Nonomuraea jiangxiensis]SDK49893.1 Pimeloyl-ACP methyl ester carboxylesterase [Nonomuraea jiangxiensis]
MSKIISADGTPIAYTRTGQGPAVILVDGALSHRAQGINTGLATALAGRFTVYTYDRRGRGESGDTAPFAPEREIEDLAALVAEAGRAHVYGTSSGAALALAAVDSGVPVERLALYEPPFIVDGTRPAIPDDYVRRLDELVATDRRADAIRYFFRTGVGLPGFVVGMMRLMPAWPKLKAVAHTLPYDVAFVAPYERGEPYPAAHWASVKVPTLVMDGGKSQAWIRNAAESLAGLLPNAEYRTLAGQTHIVKPAALAPVLEGFFR